MEDNKNMTTEYTKDENIPDEDTLNEDVQDGYLFDEDVRDEDVRDEEAGDDDARDDDVRDEEVRDDDAWDDDIQDILDMSERDDIHIPKQNKLGVSWFRDRDGLIAAFAIPVIVMIIIFVQRGIFPFGERSFLRTDMYHQYAPFFSEFKQKLLDGGSLLYSWDIGLGVNFSAIYAYYLASPLNWLIVLCPKAYVIEFMTYMIVFKIGLCGLTSSYYFKKHSKVSSLGIAFFGIFYALSGYMAAYSWDIMWLDCIALFPLVCLGLERLVDEKKGILYAVTLGICITSNYYISIMICIFMVIYFCARLILRGRTRIKDFFISVGQFAGYSLIAGGVSAVVLLPEIYALQMTASGDFSFPKTWSSYFSIVAMMARHMAGVEVEIGLDHWPNIYCGVVVLLIGLMYMVNRKIELKEKIVYLTMILFFYASFSINVLNYMWHGFHFPNSLPCRQSFIYILLILYMCFRVYDNIDGNTVKHLGIAFLCSSGFVLMCQQFVTDEGFHFMVYYGALILLGLYALLMYLYMEKKANINVILVIALALVSVESAINTTATSVTTINRTTYMDDNADVRKLTYETPRDSFYRFDKVTRKTKDDGAWMNFRSVSLFSSTANADMSDFFKRVGCESSTNAYSITGATPFMDTLLAVRYGLYSQKSDNPNLVLIDQSGDTYLYENPSVLSIGYIMDGDLEENWMTGLSNPADVQNDLCDVLGVGYVLKKVDSFMDGNRMSWTPTEDGMYYVHVENTAVDEVDATVGSRSMNFDNLKRGYLIELGYCKAGEEISLLADDEDQLLQASAYRFDYDSLKMLYEKLKPYEFTVTSLYDTHIEGTISSDKSGVLMFSIPYDKGWSITVDGEERSPRKYLDAWLAVDVTAGNHTISLDYTPQGWKLGLMVSGISIFLLLEIIIICRLRDKKRRLRRR